MLQYALTTQYHIPMYNKYFDKYDFHHMFCNVCYLLLGTVFTGLADGRVVAFKGQDLWDVTRIGKNLTGCGKIKYILYTLTQWVV